MTTKTDFFERVQALDYAAKWKGRRRTRTSVPFLCVRGREYFCSKGNKSVSDVPSCVQEHTKSHTGIMIPTPDRPRVCEGVRTTQVSKEVKSPVHKRRKLATVRCRYLVDPPGIKIRNRSASQANCKGRTASITTFAMQLT